MLVSNIKLDNRCPPFLVSTSVVSWSIATCLLTDNPASALCRPNKPYGSIDPYPNDEKLKEHIRARLAEVGACYVFMFVLGGVCACMCACVDVCFAQ